MIIKPKFETIFHSEPKRIGNLEIYYNSESAGYVKEIEATVKAIAKSMHIDMKKSISGDITKVYVYPSVKVFYAFFR